MRSWNVLFYAAQALFDEELFPRCKMQQRRLTTRVDEPRADQPPLNIEDAPPGPPGPFVPWDNFGYDMYCPIHPSQTPAPAPPPPAPAPAPQTPPEPLAQLPALRGIPPGPRSTMQRGHGLDTPPRPSLPRPKSPKQLFGPPRIRHPPQTRAGPSTRPQIPPAAAPLIPARSLQHPVYRRLRTPSPTEEGREPSPTPAPRRSLHLRRPPTQPGNIYGEQCHPSDIEQEIHHDTAWECYTSGTSSLEDAPPVQMPGGMMPPIPPQAAPQAEEGELEYTDIEENLSPRSPGSNGSHGSNGSDESNGNNGSSDSVEGHLHPPGDLHSLVQEGGVRYLNYLLAKADTPSSDVPEISKIREWSYKDLLRLPKSQQIEWMDTCHQELDSLHKHDVYDLVNPPPGRRIICNHWVFDRKTDGRKRACLVAKGFSQVEGIDYNDIFSPVMRYESVHLIVALAALQQWHMSSVDVKTAFLYGELDEELYMEQPEGFKCKGHEHKVFCLKRALYGLKLVLLQLELVTFRKQT